jgi:hypothetical protein
MKLGRSRDGYIQGFCAKSQARAICAGVARFLSATALRTSTNARLALRASGEKRGTLLRKSVGSNFVVSWILPVRNPTSRVSQFLTADYLRRAVSS